MMQNVEVVREFSKTPLKHRMSKYLLDYILTNQDLLTRLIFVTNRSLLSNTMMIAQAGAEGVSFELEISVVEADEVSLINERVVKQSKKNKAFRVHDPIQAVEVLRKFKGLLHVQLIFARETPNWYEQVAKTKCPTKRVSLDFATIVREQIDLALVIILLRSEIDAALKNGDKKLFEQKVKEYNKIFKQCLWQFD